MPPIKGGAKLISGLSEHTIGQYYPEQATAYQNEEGQARNNTHVEVGTIGIFEDGSVILNSRGY